MPTNEMESDMDREPMSLKSKAKITMSSLQDIQYKEDENEFAYELDKDDLSLEEIIPDVPYNAPEPNFIKVLYGVSQVAILNSNCGRKIFMDYLRQRVGVKASYTVDICDQEGRFLNIDELDINENVDFLFKHGGTYIVCRLIRDDHGLITSIKPILKQWGKLYPKLKEVFASITDSGNEEYEWREPEAFSTNTSSKKDLMEMKKKGK